MIVLIDFFTVSYYAAKV